MDGFFSTEGRLNISRYILHLVVIVIVFVGVRFIIGMLSIWFPIDDKMIDGISNLIGVIAFGFSYFLITKRLHDLNRSDSHFWLLFIPFYNIWLSLNLLFRQGTVGPNQYGPDPLSRASTV